MLIAHSLKNLPISRKSDAFGEEALTHLRGGAVKVAKMEANGKLGALQRAAALGLDFALGFVVLNVNDEVKGLDIKRGSIIRSFLNSFSPLLARL